MKVILFGIGKFAEYVSYILTHESEFKVCGFCVDKEFIPDSKHLMGLPICDFENVHQKFPPEDFKLFVAVGYNKLRKEKIKTAKEKGYHFISFLSENAILFDDLKYGENVFVSEDSIIQPFTSLGEGTIVLGGRIAHHSNIGKNVLLSCSTLGANTTVKDNSFLGLNSLVKPNVIIGENNIIGMGAIIEKNT
jgi:sugar O-acyltransferase (sialic acid O-acetyltransferase NeuD family)